MPRRTPSSIAYVAFVAVLWAVALPAVLIADSGRGIFPARGVGFITGGALLALGGLALVDAGARVLAGAGIGLFGVRPGSRLVRTGIYSRVRNPIEIGTVLLSFAPWIAFDIDLMWVIPAGAIVYFVAGVGPYEDRHLLEAFEGDFRRYRAAVSKWLPR